MGLFLIPAGICEKIERSMNAYWWVTGNEKKGIRWMNWERMCEVKETGGLGFRKLYEFNLTMLAKQAWRLINNVNPLVTALMKRNIIHILISWMLNLERTLPICGVVYWPLKKWCVRGVDEGLGTGGIQVYGEARGYHVRLMVT